SGGPEGGRNALAGALQILLSTLGVLARLAWAWPGHLAIGLTPALLVAIVGWELGGDAPDFVKILIAAVVIVFAFIFGGLALALRVKRAATRELVEDNYGLCSGMGEARGELPPLTIWLHRKFQSLSGLGAEVLTFGHLYDP